jgi:hypothetical protein
VGGKDGGTVEMIVGFLTKRIAEHKREAEEYRRVADGNLDSDELAVVTESISIHTAMAKAYEATLVVATDRRAGIVELFNNTASTYAGFAATSKGPEDAASYRGAAHAMRLAARYIQTGGFAEEKSAARESGAAPKELAKQIVAHVAASAQGGSAS